VEVVEKRVAVKEVVVLVKVVEERVAVELVEVVVTLK
jgi:hypothetical protein